MTYLPLTVLAVIVTGAACAGSIVTQSKDDARASGLPGGLRCELDISSSGRTVTIIATAKSDTAVTGEYHLDIRQRSAAGGSTIRQAGDFALAAGKTTSLSESQFSGQRSNFEAELVVKARGKQDSCTSAGL